MEKILKTDHQTQRAMTYHTLDSLHLPHNRAAQMIRIGFAADQSSLDVQFWDANHLIGCLRWECGVSDEPLKRRFARLYISVCRKIPPYCARDIYTLFAAVEALIDGDLSMVEQ